MKLAVWYQKYLDTVMRSFACRLLYKWYRMLESGSTRMTPAINEPAPRLFIINFIQYTYLRLQVCFNRYRIVNDLLTLYLSYTSISKRVPRLNKVQQRGRVIAALSYLMGLLLQQGPSVTNRKVVNAFETIQNKTKTINRLRRVRRRGLSIKCVLRLLPSDRIFIARNAFYAL